MYVNFVPHMQYAYCDDEKRFEKIARVYDEHIRVCLRGGGCIVVVGFMLYAADDDDDDDDETGETIYGKEMHSG